uniref:Embryo surrounding factor 1 brassicaceae domain-containing protein n=1 Tax=Setaria viridis TaxID=4556 RepID=A0A4U6TFH4_SETVI|nr:hypothetical protein SEVIR_8G045400v2 [Setaria viridis]
MPAASDALLLDILRLFDVVHQNRCRADVCRVVASPGRIGRPHLLEAGNTLAADANSTSFDETKIYVVLCYGGTCDYFGNGMQDCYCCGDGDHKQNCHKTMEECKAKCPKFPPSFFQSTRDSVTTNTTLYT